ncbi:Fe-S-containing protein [Patescibacteria group bacterium]
MKKIVLMLSIVFVLLFTMTGCLFNQNNTSEGQASVTSSDASKNFEGTIGDFIEIENGKVTLAANKVDDGKAHFYNTTLDDGDPVYFFVVKSPDGNFRAAANGCQVCGDALQGFHQEGDSMVCNTCGNSYPLNKIATEKGGCNPAPINPNLEVVDGNITISMSELESIKQFFN